MTAPARRLVIHAGSPKCGSTFLQRVLLRNREVLLGLGINYPVPTGKHPGNGGWLPRWKPEDLEAQFRIAPVVVLSHEDLFPMAEDLGHVRDFVTHTRCSLDVQVFLRPFSDFVFGDYSQTMKQHFEDFVAQGLAYGGRSFEEFAVHRLSHMQPHVWLKSWRDVVGGHLHLESHVRIRATMESRLQISGGGLDWAIERDATNPSLLVSDCEALAAGMVAGETPDVLRRRLSRAYGRAGMSDPGRTDERRAWLEALFRGQVAAIHRQFGYDNRPGAQPVGEARLIETA